MGDVWRLTITHDANVDYIKDGGNVREVEIWLCRDHWNITSLIEAAMRSGRAVRITVVKVPQ